MGPRAVLSIGEQFGTEFFLRAWAGGGGQILLVPLSVMQLQLLFLLLFSNGSHPWAAWPGVAHTVLLRL